MINHKQRTIASILYTMQYILVGGMPIIVLYLTPRTYDGNATPILSFQPFRGIFSHDRAMFYDTRRRGFQLFGNEPGLFQATPLALVPEGLRDPFRELVVVLHKEKQMVGSIHGDEPKIAFADPPDDAIDKVLDGWNLLGPCRLFFAFSFHGLENVPKFEVGRVAVQGLVAKDDTIDFGALDPGALFVVVVLDGVLFRSVQFDGSSCVDEPLYVLGLDVATVRDGNILVGYSKGSQTVVTLELGSGVEPDNLPVFLSKER